MFGDLIQLVKLLTSAYREHRAQQPSSDRIESFERLVLLHRVFSDVVSTGHELLDIIESNPIERMKKGTESEIKQLRADLESMTALQGHRLYFLSSKLHEDYLYKFVDPASRRRIETLIGTKASRVKTLSGIISSIVSTAMFCGVETDDQRSHLASSMYELRQDGKVNVDESRRLLHELDEELTKLDAYVKRSLSESELVVVAKKVSGVLDS
jgi:hypothetical protein